MLPAKTAHEFLKWLWPALGAGFIAVGGLVASAAQVWEPVEAWGEAVIAGAVVVMGNPWFWIAVVLMFLVWLMAFIWSGHSVNALQVATNSKVAPLAELSREGANWARWDHIHKLTLFQVAHLWEGIEPPSYFAAAADPKAVVALTMLIQAVDSGKLGAIGLQPENALRAPDPATRETLVHRTALVKYANDTNQRVLFLRGRSSRLGEGR